MSNAETAAWIRKYYAENLDHVWSWPTDACGYDQHIRFVDHRNKNWKGGSSSDFMAFALAYADTLEEVEHDR